MENLRRHGPWIGLLLLLTLLTLGAPLFSTDRALSDKGGDIAKQFLFSRGFAAHQITQGNLPFWNPYIYGGVPFLGDFQSALLYPFNLIFLVMPLAVALNWSIALHVFLLGANMYAWTAWRGFRPFAAFVAAAAAMLGGTFIFHVYAGHLSNLCSMAWAPLVFLGIDGWLARRHAGWVFLASAAAALQIYAGHPQYVYYTALIAGLYALIHLPSSPRLLTAISGLAMIYPLAALFSAAQLLPGLAAAAESVRGGGVNYEFAATYSLPPENLLTAFLPWAFGNLREVPYWGRCFLWEMNLYAGAGALLLAGQGLWKGKYLRLLLLIGAVVLLGLGTNTPLHGWLYRLVPGFGDFRGTSKFLFFAGLFTAFLAGAGLDSLLRKEKASRLVAGAGLLAGLIFLAAGSGIAGSQGFQKFASVCLTYSLQNSALPGVLANDGVLSSAQVLLSHTLKISGGILLVCSALLLACRWKHLAAYGAGCLAILDLLFFARGTMSSFSVPELVSRTHPSTLIPIIFSGPEVRMLDLVNLDQAMQFSTENIWGYDPTVLKRYAELVYLSQGHDPGKASQYLTFKNPHPILQLLRGVYVFVPKQNEEVKAIPLEGAGPRFFPAGTFQIITDRREAFAALKEPSFDLRQTVLLESEPNPPPSPAESNFDVNVLDSSTDHRTLEISAGAPKILVMTDAFAKGWRATALPGSVQSHYEILPADHAIRAIPLSAGKHLLRIEYIPPGFTLGLILSVVSILAAILCFAIRPIRTRLAFQRA